MKLVHRTEYASVNFAQNVREYRPVSNISGMLFLSAGTHTLCLAYNNSLITVLSLSLTGQFYAYEV
jgi:hypothetical protein